MSHPTPTRGLNADSPLTEAARRLLTSRLADVRHAEDALAGPLTEDGVHDLRVATRRLRAALHLFRGLGPALVPVEKDVKRLQDALGEVRDLHVQGAWFDKAARKVKPAQRAGYEALRTRITAPLSRREQRLRRALQRWKQHTVPALLAATEHLEGRGRYGGRRVRKPLRHRLRSLRSLMKEYAEAPDALIAHAMRRTVKKLRYEAELVRPARRHKLDTLLETLVPLQEVLGDLHDADVRLGLLEGLAARGTEASRTAARALLEQVGEERTGHATHTEHELKRWRKQKLARELRQLLE